MRIIRSMGLISVGINHKTAAIHLREKFAFSPEHLPKALTSLAQKIGCRDVVIVSTCNRTEVYAASAQASQLEAWLHDYHGLEAGSLSRCLYHHQGEQVVQHLMRVSCGLDSQILGEPQILGQIKQAYSVARATNTVSGLFERLFQQVFSVAKMVRTQTGIGALSVSVAYAAVELAQRVFGALADTRVLLIGAGETIELVAKYLQQHQVKHMTIANRTLTRAQALADHLNAEAMTLGQIPKALPSADIVVSSTASTLPILGKGLIEQTLKKRRHRPMFFVDLAVPRDIEAEVAEIDEAFLYTVDDLQDLVKTHLDARQAAALQAEAMAQSQAGLFMDWLRGQDLIHYVLAYRQNATQHKEQLLVKAKQRLAAGEDPEEVLEAFSHQLTNKLIHAPTQALAQACHRGDTDRLAQLRDILDIQFKKDT